MIWKMLSRNVYKSDVTLIDQLSDTPETTFWSKWFGGIIIPIVVGLYGVGCIASRQVVFSGSNASTDLSGKAAVVFGAAWISGACFLHFHYFWPTLKRLWVLTDLGKTISLLCLIGTGGYVGWSIIMG